MLFIAGSMSNVAITTAKQFTASFNVTKNGATTPEKGNSNSNYIIILSIFQFYKCLNISRHILLCCLKVMTLNMFD